MPGEAMIGDSGLRTISTVLGRIPSGLYIVTAQLPDGQQTGLLASWVQQASFEPPMLTVAVNQKRYLNSWLEISPVLGVNVIAEEQKDLLKHFGTGFEPGINAFEGIAVQYGVTGTPLLTSALGYLEGEVVSHMATGDHTIYALQVTGAGEGAAFSTAKPWVHLRKNGLKY